MKLRNLLNILMLKQKFYVYDLEIAWLHGEHHKLTTLSLCKIETTEKVEILLAFNFLLACCQESIEIKSFELRGVTWK